MRPPTNDAMTESNQPTSTQHDEPTGRDGRILAIALVLTAVLALLAVVFLHGD